MGEGGNTTTGCALSRIRGWISNELEKQGVEYRIEIFWRANLPDGRVVDLLSQIAHLGLDSIQRVQVSDLYFLRGDLSPAELDRLADELLAEPAVEGYRYRLADAPPPAEENGLVVEVGYRPGVTDPVAWHLLRRAQLLGIGSIEATATGTRYTFEGPLSTADLHRIAREILCNDVIQAYALGPLQPAFVPRAEPSDETEIIPLREANDETLARMSVERVLFLSLEEMRAIRQEFCRLGRDPTDVELETLAQTWSEHCQHKAFKATIHYLCQGGMRRVLPIARVLTPPYEETIPGLLRTYLQAATERLEPLHRLEQGQYDWDDRTRLRDAVHV